MMDKKPKGGMMLMIGMGGKKPSGSMDDAADQSQDESMGEDDKDDDSCSIDMPEGFEPPDDVQEGQSFDVTCRMHVQDGKLCIESINGVKTDGGTEGDEEDDSTSPPEEKPDDSSKPMSLDDAMSAHRKQSAY